MEIEIIALLLESARSFESVKSELNIDDSTINNTFSLVKKSERFSIWSRNGLYRIRLKSEMEKENITHQVKLLYNEGLTPIEIANKINTSNKTVHELLVRLKKRGDIDYNYNSVSQQRFIELLNNGTCDVKTILQETNLKNQHSLSMLIARLKKMGLIDSKYIIKDGNVFLSLRKEKTLNRGSYLNKIIELSKDNKSIDEISILINRDTNYIRAMISYAKKKRLF